MDDDEQKYPSQLAERFQVRLPNGMRDRIAQSAERNGRSMNAEIVQALDQFFPPEPSIEQILERVHATIDMASKANSLPYRKVLLDALAQLSDRLASGLEFDQFESRTLPPHSGRMGETVDRINRWRRAKEHGVEQVDLERELQRGLLKGLGGSRTNQVIADFREGKIDRALRGLRLDTVKFADPTAAHKAIETYLRSYYEENWGDPDAPWVPGD
ncbi:Arc family DNA-binding protein [Mesorhizobium australicum]|uniref:Arc family DNA-binding protein n=1 Tax=Mesorhizobium australicum TaxID=536018 RepID=UPI003339BDF7